MLDIFHILLIRSPPRPCAAGAISHFMVLSWTNFLATLAELLPLCLSYALRAQVTCDKVLVFKQLMFRLET